MSRSSGCCPITLPAPRSRTRPSISAGPRRPARTARSVAVTTSRLAAVADGGGELLRRSLEQWHELEAALACQSVRRCRYGDGRDGVAHPADRDGDATHAVVVL